MSAHRLTAICTTIARPNCAAEFLRSLRSACPDLRAILAEQSETPELRGICSELGVEHLALPFDCGVSFARNALVSAVSTDYFLITEDDFRFPGPPDTGLCSRFLDANPEFLCVTGALDDLREKHGAGHHARNLAIDETGNGLIILPLHFVKGSAIGFEDAQIYPCDMGSNWGVFRKAAFAERNLRWDEEYKIGGEHLDFSLRLFTQHRDLRIGFTDRLRCQHVDGDEGRYPEFRSRKGWFEIFRAKWPFRYRYDLGGPLRMTETFDRAEPLPAPQADKLREALRIAQAENAALRKALETRAETAS